MALEDFVSMIDDTIKREIKEQLDTNLGSKVFHNFKFENGKFFIRDKFKKLHEILIYPHGAGQFNAIGLDYIGNEKTFLCFVENAKQHKDFKCEVIGSYDDPRSLFPALEKYINSKVQSGIQKIKLDRIKSLFSDEYQGY